MKKVSIVTPVYNVDKYIAETINSVLVQTHQNFELLLVDNGSSDRSVEVCQQFRDPRIRLLYQAQRGACAARNLGIREATGDYIAFLDGDDIWLPEKLAKHVQHLESNSQLGISFSRSAFIDEEGKPLGIYQMPRLNNICISHVLCRNPIGNGSAAVLRREALEAVRTATSIDGKLHHIYWDEQLQGSQDLDLWFRIIIQSSWLMEGIPDALTLYRVNPTGISANLGKKQESWEYVIEKTRVYAPAIVAAWEAPARAYHLRYLARRAVTLRSGIVAVSLFNQSLRTYWKLLMEEPRRTLLTGGAAYLLYLLPKFLYIQLEMLMLNKTGINQQREIQQHEVRQLV